MIRDLWEARIAAAASALDQARREFAHVVTIAADTVHVGPHLCEDCESYCTVISRAQYDAFDRDGIIPCECGGIVRPIRDTPAGRDAR